MTITNLENAQDGILAIWITPEDSPLTSKLTSQISDIESKTQMVIVSEDTLPNWVTGGIQKNQEIAKKKSLYDTLIFVLKTGSSCTYLTHRDNPEPKYNWAEIAHQFGLNYFDNSPDGDVWRWGQIVPEDGEYLCRDCGYIEDFTAGQIFPVCEVCLAGDPEGPLEISEGYWEKL